MAETSRKYRYELRGADLPGQLAVENGDGASVGGQSSGGYRMQLSGAGAQNVCLYMGDVLPFAVADLISAAFILKTSAIDAASQLAFGLCTARNDTIDNLAQHLSFRAINGNALVVESDDGASEDNNDIPTGLVVGDEVFRRYSINLAERVSTMEPPSTSKGTGSHVGFYGGNPYGSARRVASGTRFDISAYTGGLQPYVQLQKTADNNTDYVEVLEIEIEAKLPGYA